MDADRRLAYLEAMGIQVWERRDAAAEATPAARLRVEPMAAPSAPMATVLEAPASRQPNGAPPRPAAGDAASAISTMDWPTLRATVRECRACALCETRTQAVFGVGDPRADLMVIGEAPGADEDRVGEPFVGRAGQLLTLMLQAIGLRRDQVFIANVLKCRPPGNRDPRPDEARECEPYLLRQIELVAPRVILAVGRIAAQNLLRTDAPIGRLRGRWHQFGEPPRPLYITYHPAYLLRSPDKKGTAWHDLIEVLRRLHQTRVENAPPVPL
ncbi:uracil-DNA glycosylase [Thioalkalicoccus limnaeus]|uniref:Type-4 uracil-DNA glycosylase n=1 Tax=Thioalkalicoccus limnaeus TaxID=120681 RepID=A0ABV4BFV6_9GAMM